MENSSQNSQSNSVKDEWLTTSMFIARIMKGGITLLVIGAVVMVLSQLDIALEYANPENLNPIAFAGGSAALLLLTVMGVPLVPAAVAGTALWLLLQSFI